MFQRILLIGCALAIAVATPALGFRNKGGAMLVHTNDAVVYTSSDDYCVSTLPGTCEELVTRTDKPLEEAEALIWCLAVFAPEADPGVTTVQFGVTHNLPSADYISNYSPCGPNPLELPDGGWPFSGGNPELPGQSGNLVTYSEPVYDQLFPFYWFAVIGSLSDTYFGTRTYPATDEAKFVDDGNPPREDLIDRFGIVRWAAEGENSCPVPEVPGACCTPWATCVILTESECTDTQGQFGLKGGSYLGDGTTCDPFPNCGACCTILGEGRDCTVTSPAKCAEMDGWFSYSGSRCTYSAVPESTMVGWYCGEIAAKPSSWGILKSLFR